MSKQNKTVYILSCGPSLKANWSEELHEFLKLQDVIAVKKAFEYCPSCKYNVVNGFNGGTSDA